MRTYELSARSQSSGDREEAANLDGRVPVVWGRDVRLADCAALDTDLGQDRAYRTILVSKMEPRRITRIRYSRT